MEDRAKDQSRGKRNWRGNNGSRNSIPENGASSSSISFSGKKSLTSRSMGFTYLDNLLIREAEEITSTLVRERKGFLELLEQNLSPDIIVLIVRILRKICDSKFDTTKLTVLQSALNEKFVNDLQTFVACLPSQNASQRKVSTYFWNDPNSFFTNVYEICDHVLKALPTFACKRLPVILKSLKIYIPVLEQEQEINISEEIRKNVEKKLEFIQICVKDNEKNQKKNKEETVEVGEEPPDDFRQISVYPSPAEIVGGQGFLRENVVKGPYQNVNHYLDVQFRLLREDFVGPLREGITSYRSSVPINQIDDVKIHKDVRFLNTETINEYYCLRVQFASKKKKLPNFETSKRFMFGALLCFTKDNFNTLFFGKVAQRKLEDLKNGQLIVAFDEKLTIDYNVDYLMVECSVYFEPYFHVLTVLKNMSEENFPMERYIIRVNPSVQSPEYLTDGNTVKYTIENHEFDPTSQWPDEQFYNFNESQLTAFKAAITQEFTVIQGPPGTGKTYLGLKVVQTLLENKNYWYEKTPILVICYTNHALDQFLEGLIPFTRHIIRVGGQSKNPNLDEFNLRNKVSRDAGVYQKRIEVQHCLQTIKQKTEILQQIEYWNSVLSFYLFEQVVPEFSSSWFGKATRNQILDWLLEGAECGENLINLQEYLNTIQVQAELNNINLDDEDLKNDLDSHINAAFDNIFDEVINTTHNNRFESRNFLITLKSVRDQINLLQDELTQLRQEPSPSLEHLIREERIHYQCEELTEKYEYLKAQLSAGRRLRNLVEKPEHIDLNNPHNMDFQDRWKLYFYWLSLYRNHESDVLRMTCENFPEVYKVYEEMREIEDLNTMRNALVVGMTTTSAARLRSTLQTLKNPIVIVEEAAEVLEAHIVTSVTKECKQLILIGDHKQLRPSTANYTVEKQYQLGISLFERMINNNIHCYTLNVQHRMRPEISRLIQSTIYPFLENHPSVHQRPTIVGVDNCLFFLNHKHPEEACEGSSKVNQHEVTFLISLARHLILNGYQPENITILAAYLGQFFAFKKEKKLHQDLLKDVRISVLDNYQGEESDIILLSLVRNNEENKIGFLKIQNRVCVALSRARNGMYIMGNIDQLCHERTVWRDIRKILEEQKAIGEALPVRCQIHQDQVTLLKCEADFLAISEGGCNKICDAELPCGHKCASLCHIRDRTHTLFKCQVECNKNLCKTDATHICKKMCFEECGPCTYTVQKPLACGHIAGIPCHKDPESYNCQVLVMTKLPCGHETDKPCHADPVTFRCPYICDVKVEPCGHACEQLCHIRRDPDHLEYKCRKPCAKFQKNCTLLEEDHRCKKLCYQDCDECRIVVRKRRTVCSHMYDVACCENVDEILCRKPCTKLLQCGHNCKSKCDEPCQECPLTVFKTSPVCGHPIKIRCSEQPDRKYCNKKCPLKLPCGHPCQEKCNEPCTTNCKVIVSCPPKLAECGHFVTAVECSMAQTKVNPKLLVKYCREPCRIKLKCDHSCSGSCGECFQGRIHKRCAQKCGAILVCDHPCDTPCRQACRPCSRKCTYRCEHSGCSKSCGEICTPCVEPCPRRCVHRKCHKKCWEICDVPPCTEPCQELLKCGHRCIGFCGDPCPSKCLVCDKDEVLDVFFGTESEEARYVFLKDCNHIVENEGMEKWLQQSQNQISYKGCPKCKTAIKTTQRYSDYIKMAVRDVAEVKNRINGRPEELKQQYNEIREMMKMLQARCRVTFNAFYSSILGLLKVLQGRMQFSGKGKRQYLNKYELQAIKSKLEILEYITKICCDDKALVQNSQELFLPQVLFIIKEISRDPYYITDQEIEDINREVNRLSRIVELGRIKNTTQYKTLFKGDKIKSLMDDIEKIMFSCKRFSKEDNGVLKKLLKELSTFTASGIAISEEEKKAILSAMGFSKGHWFKCPNGHIYAIGECGGAMEEAKCNECGAKIGGRYHRLLDDNTVATEMDGAMHGAWSETANLENYNIQDFE